MTTTTTETTAETTAAAVAAVSPAMLTDRHVIPLTGPWTRTTARAEDLAAPGMVFLPRPGEVVRDLPGMDAEHIVIAVDLDEDARTVTLTALDAHRIGDATPTTATLSAHALADVDPVRHPRPAEASTVGHLADLIAAQAQRHSERLSHINAHANDYAGTEAWCGVYDDAAERLGFESRVSNYRVTVSISYEVDLIVEARDSDTAADMVTHNMVTERAREHDLTLYDWDINDTELDD